MYYYNNEPLQLSYRNTYTPPEKIEIVLQLINMKLKFWDALCGADAVDCGQYWSLDSSKNRQISV